MNQESRSGSGIDAALDRSIQEVQRGLRTTRIVGALALAAGCGWFGWLHSQLRTIDVESVAMMAEQRAREALPQAVSELKGKLESAAPSLVAQGRAKALAMPAMLRERLEEYADARVREGAAHMRALLVEHVKIDVDAVKRSVEERYAGLNERDQLRALVRDSARECRTELAQLIHAPADSSRRAFDDLASEIERRANGRDLTREEEVQREILATLSQLLPHLKNTTTPALAFGIDGFFGSIGNNGSND